MRRGAIFLSGALAGAGPAWAHGGAAAGPHLGAPDVLAALLLGAGGLIYAAGALRLWRRAGPGRGLPPLRAAAFACGLAVAAWALFGPVDALAETSFTAHMIQHLALMLVAAPLLVLGRPRVAALWALPAQARVRFGGWLSGAGWTWLRGGTGIALAWTAFLLALWIWHLPQAYDAALASGWVHMGQHASFLAAAALFWLAATDRAPGEGRGAAFIAVFATALHACALAALVTTSRAVWYARYAEAQGALGLAPLDDQQLGGLVMWVPGGAVLVGAAVAILAQMLRDLDLRQERAGR